MLSIDWGTSDVNPCRLTPTSSSLLSEPSMVKLFERLLRPFTENSPAVPTPGPMPGPTLVPMCWGGGATPGTRNARASNVRMPCQGSDTSSRSLKYPPRVALFEFKSRGTSFLDCGAPDDCAGRCVEGGWTGVGEGAVGVAPTFRSTMGGG